MALFYYKPPFGPNQKPCHKNLTQFWHKICHRPCTDCATNRYYQIYICEDTILFYQWLWNTIRCLNTSPNKLFRWTYETKFMFCPYVWVGCEMRRTELELSQFSQEKASGKIGWFNPLFDGWFDNFKGHKNSIIFLNFPPFESCKH